MENNKVISLSKITFKIKRYLPLWLALKSIKCSDCGVVFQHHHDCLAFLLFEYFQLSLIVTFFDFVFELYRSSSSDVIDSNLRFGTHLLRLYHHLDLPNEAYHIYNDKVNSVLFLFLKKISTNCTNWVNLTKDTKLYNLYCDLRKVSNKLVIGSIYQEYWFNYFVLCFFVIF